MDQVRISELNPELPALDSKQFKAVVTLIWPYSSSARQFALLLADPDFRLRRRNGQVRARFSGSSAKTIATTGVGIGDEVILSLRSAQFVKEGAVNTPGKSIDWELSYTKEVVAQVFRNGNLVANLEVAPTSASRSRSPIHRESLGSSISAIVYSSPAFLKRIRLSDSPFFGAPYDPLADDNEDGHDKKRRRKSYKDWKAWTYSARTPSPEKDDDTMAENIDFAEASPSRAAQLPRTPVSPSKPEVLSVAAGPITRPGEQQIHTEEAITPAEDQITDETADRSPPTKRSKREHVVHDADYYDLYAGPDEFPPSDPQYAFGGDTEPDTEVNTEEEGTVQNELEVVSASTTEANTEEHEDSQLNRPEEEMVEMESIVTEQASAEDDIRNTSEEEGLIEVIEVQQDTESPLLVRQDEDQSSVQQDEHEAVPKDQILRTHGAPKIVMPPPTLPTLQTEFGSHVDAALLIPLGSEPASPVLQPQDSATLPLPSPFPDEAGRDGNVNSYFDQSIANQQGPEREFEDEDEQELPSEASYIMETSFFSSISSSKASVLHPNHESAFTPVRFTFGMDGAGYSRPVDLSSPAPEGTPSKASKDAGHDAMLSRVEQEAAEAATRESESELVPQDIAEDQVRDEVVEETATMDDGDVQVQAAEAGQEEPDVVVLSSGPESEAEEDEEDEEDEKEDEEDEDEDEEEWEEKVDSDVEVYNHAHANGAGGSPSPTDSVEDVLEDAPQGQYLEISDEEDEAEPTSTHHSAAVSAVVYLDSPSTDHTDRGSSLPAALPMDVDAADGQVRERSPTTNLRSLSPKHHQDMPSQELDKHTELESHSEFVNLDFATEAFDHAQVPDQQTVTHTHIQALETEIDPSDAGYYLPVNNDVPQLASDDTNNYMHDIVPTEDLSQEPGWDPTETGEHHPDIKMESVEEESLFQTTQPDTLGQSEDHATETIEPSGELLIAVPDEEHPHKVGELQTISVPATAPARNTRSKTKASLSPSLEDTAMPKRTTRSTRSKASVTSVTQVTQSPPRTRTRTTLSPSQEATQTSPYSLRSQSKLLSPTKSTSGATSAATRRISRKHATRRSVESLSDLIPSQVEAPDPFLTSFEPSQELGGSYSRYSNVALVKDSEEESVRSEHSISTLQNSDTLGGLGADYPTFSDPLMSVTPDEDLMDVKPPASTAPEPRTQSATELITEAPAANVSRQLRSAGPSEDVPLSPRNLRGTRRHGEDLFPEHQEVIEEMSKSRTSRAVQKTKNVSHPTVSGEREGDRYRSTPPPPSRAPEVDELMRNSPPAAFSPHLTRKQTAMGSNSLITPEATQQTTAESQRSVTTVNQGQDSLLTPQLTQKTSAGLRSFQTNTDVDMETIADAPATLTSPISKITPRRNVTTTDIASASPSPRSPSSDLDPDTSPIPPSIGLSTPLAYYTPLKDLIYFLNRSPQFHSATNPDILALVTRSTSTPERAKKGPRHFNTTLHITDLSSYPVHTTVQIFRAYQNALPTTETGDVILLRAFAVKSLNRKAMLVSADESAWCVWRWGKPVWGAKRGSFGELRAREEVKGPEVERGEGEWREVERLRAWFVGGVREEMVEGDEEGLGKEQRPR